MNRLLTCLLAVLGLNTACGQQNFENADVQGFAELVRDSNVVVLDVRTAEEYADGHIERAVNIDYKKDDFMDRAKAALPTGKTIAIYCRSGRRSGNAASMLAPEGYVLVNLKGGIIDWQNAGMPVVKAGKD